MVKYQVKIGKGVLTFEGQTMTEIHRWGKIWGSLPSACSHCNSEELYLSYNSTKEGFEYHKLTCKKCDATLTIKKSKQNEWYIDDSVMRVYSSAKSTTPQSSALPDADNATQENIPF